MGVMSRRMAPAGSPSTALVGCSPAMNAVRAMVAKVADSHASVLITGPSGSGKDVVARLLHEQGSRAAAPFVALNCAAVPADLLESELFGHEQGAFTGAVKARAGRFEAAHGGSLFLDEVGDMAAAMQAKLLRALETRVVERVGGMLPLNVDVRVIAATSVDLDAAIAAGRFRADLLYRLDVIPIVMPALNQRPEDVPLLAAHFIAIGGHRLRFTAAAMDTLMRQAWPGNVRELRNFIERAAVHHNGETIGCEELIGLLRPHPLTVVPTPPPAAAVPPPQLGPEGVDLKQLLADMERAYIRAALEQSGGTIARTARLLGLQRTTLIEKMRRLNLDAAPA